MKSFSKNENAWKRADLRTFIYIYTKHIYRNQKHVHLPCAYIMLSPLHILSAAETLNLKTHIFYILILILLLI